MQKTLRGLRAGRCLTVREVAGSAGVTPRTYNLIELGRGRPSLRTVRKIADALGVEPDEVAELAQAVAEHGGKDGA